MLFLSSKFAPYSTLVFVVPYISMSYPANALRPEQNGHHIGDNIFEYIFLEENVCILIPISPRSIKCVPNGQ